MSILSDTAHENMINSEAAVTYILKALFSDVFKFDGTTEVMISENIKRGCPHIWKDPNYRIISDKLFHWWLSDMPYIYLAMLEDQKFVPVLYENLKKIVEYDKNHSLDARVYDENKNVFSFLPKSSNASPAPLSDKTIRFHPRSNHLPLFPRNAV